MTFDRPAVLLLLLLLPVLWMWFGRRPGVSRAGLAFKCASFASLVVALADPSAWMLIRRLAVTVLMDTSASMPREAIERGQTLLRELVRRKSGAELRLITFAEHPRLHDVPDQASKVTISQALDASGGMATDVGGALQLALSTFPERGARRVLLISDGNENRGHALTDAVHARERGVEVFTLPSGGTARLPLLLGSIASPQQVFSGERFTLSLRLDSSRALAARIWITSQDRELGATAVELRSGSNPVDLDARITGSGVKLMVVHVAGEGREQELFSQAITVRRPRVLYVAGADAPSAPLLETLKLAEVDVETASVFPSAPGRDWDAVLFDNYPEQPLSPEENEALEQYVRTGGGLIFIAGDKNSQLAEEPHTPFEKLLPVRGDPPPVPKEPTALVLVLDKSRSMDGPKIAMVRQAARASVATLRPIDKIGIIAFDETFRWVVPLGPITDVAHINSLIDSIEADGSTRIYPAVQAGFDAIRHERATRRHIILLTDGVSPPGNLPQLEKTAAASHVTISDIGIGNDVNRELLEELARETRGKSYFVDEPEKIPQIISGETRDLEVTAIEERKVRAVRVRPVEFTDGVDFTHAPRLLGFVKAKARKGSETILRVDSGEPLLVRWQYGLGRVIAFMSDARSRWSAPWVSWESFGTLWPQMVRDVSHRDRTVRAGVRSGTSDGEEIVYYDVLGDADEQKAGTPQSPRVLIEAPDEVSRALPLEETSPGHYEARIPANQRGLYRIVSDNAQLLVPDAGFYRESNELKPQEINLPLLSEISRVTGGSLRPTISQLLDDKVRSVRERRRLWPYWLLLALLLDFVEVAARKGHFARLASWWRGRADSVRANRSRIAMAAGRNGRSL
ncbi:MAG TPA: VWA domain-containing protein [Verrucomicrobiae bacterium]|jgi:Ca-activated chloride channel family protein|nr:VWA domain-containing protein [Verrucomicrobiae bacterium]